MTEHTWQSGFNKGKLGPGFFQGPAAQPPKCPECGSLKTWKDGLRYTKQGEVQRWLCRSCGYRFSNPKVKIDVIKQDLVLSDSMHNLGDLDPVNLGIGDVCLKDSAFAIREDIGSHDFSIVGKTINNFLPNSRERQVCVSEREAKNLSQQHTRQNRAAGATKPTTAEVKGKIVEFTWYMKRQGYAEGTIKNRTKLLKRMIKLGANLWDPEQIKEIIAAQEKWSEGYKTLAVYAYSTFLEMEGQTWKKPRYRRPDTVPFVPLESELDQLINACGKKISIFLQGLKETGADPGELLAVRWTDINKQASTLTFNHPVKGHRARILPISKELIGRFELLPKKTERIFPMTMGSMWVNFRRQRKRVARSFNNPRLMKITFTTFRHWKATMEYHRTKDILYVKQLLGHKTLSSTMIYIDIEKAIYGQLRDEEFTVRVATTLEEDQELIEAGFEYVTERDGAKIYRKRK